MTYIVKTSLLLAALLPSSAFAQNLSDDCWKSLVPDVTVINTDTHAKYAYLQTIDSSNFQEKKSNASYGVGIVLEGIPLNMYGSYDQFKQARSDFAMKNSIKWSFDESKSVLMQKVSLEAFSAFTRCKELHARTTHGLFIWPASIEDDNAVIAVYWNKPPNGQEAIGLKFDLRGFSNNTFPKTIKDGQTYSALLDRKKGKDQIVTLNGGGYTTEPLILKRTNTTVQSDPLPVPLCQHVVNLPISGMAHIEGRSDVAFGPNEWIGTKGTYLRMEGFSFDFAPDQFPNPIPGLSLEYMCHIQGTGDSLWLKSGEFCGTRGLYTRVEGFAAKLVGPNAKYFELETSCHIEGSGDRGPYKSSEYCGTKGASLRMEALRVSVKSLGKCSN